MTAIKYCKERVPLPMPMQYPMVSILALKEVSVA